MPKFSLAGSIYFAINSFPQLNQLETPLKTSITNEIIINPKKIPTIIPVIRLNAFKTGASITFDKIIAIRDITKSKSIKSTIKHKIVKT